MSSSDMTYDAPASDEIEVTVIGPGFGEAVIVHIGQGKWFIVDSCAKSTSADPEPLTYLKSIGVSFDQVFAVFITHWDDDHCKGIAKIAEECSNAKLVMAKTFVEKDFFAFSTAFNSPMTTKVRAGTKEILKVVQECSKTGRKITKAFAERQIFTTSSVGMPSLDGGIWTFSPSDEEFDNFLAWVASQMPSVGETRRVAVKRLRNDLSVVIYVKLGNDVILLGGDLEEEGRATTGWSAILALQGRPTEKAKVFKVPHHGSENGHHDGIVNVLLDIDPIAVVAPFKNGSVSLPKESDVMRITGYATDAHATASLQGRANVKYDRTVQKTIDQAAKRFSTINADPGMVRLRKKHGLTGSWRTEYFGEATQLSKIF